MHYFCCDERRRDAVRAHPTLNGIDFLDVPDNPASPKDQRGCLLSVYFVKPLNRQLNRKNLIIEGGERIHDITIIGVTAGKGEQANILFVRLNKPGDFSKYRLSLVQSVQNTRTPSGFDPLLSAIDFFFHVDFDDESDCQTESTCLQDQPLAAEIDYMAKDYNSFRQLMLDRLTVLMPRWRERSPADVGLALVELLAYVGDYLSYRQDVIATESYLGTARRRTSVRRHARLIDYFMHDGTNARAWVQVVVNADVKKKKATDPPVLPQGTQLLPYLPGLPSRLLPKTPDYNQALDRQPEIFETMYDVDALYLECNELHFYTWGARECCLPKGATKATLQGNLTNRLSPGSILVFKEVLGPRTGDPIDADTTHRCAVRLMKVTATKDPLGKWFTQYPDDEPEQDTIDSARATTTPLEPLQNNDTDSDIAPQEGEEERPWEGEQATPFVSAEAAVPENKAVDESGITEAGESDWDPEDTVKLQVIKMNRTPRKNTEVVTEVVKVELEEERVIEIEQGAGGFEVSEVEEEAIVVESETVEETVEEAAPVDIDYSLDVTEIEWHVEDALPFPLCISGRTDFEHGQLYIEDISVALGNIVLADHGYRIESEELGTVPQVTLLRVSAQAGERCQQLPSIPVPPHFYPQLQNGPLTCAVAYNATNLTTSASAAMTTLVSDLMPLPVITLHSQASDGTKTTWHPLQDLLSSGPADAGFVVEAETGGNANLRFGDGQHGLRPTPCSSFTATYRVGNGVQGNVGAEVLAHIVSDNQNIVGVSNPLAAQGGLDPESIEEARQRAPGALSYQRRAVIPGDYAVLAGEYPGVRQATAIVRRTGSWPTVYLAVERLGRLPVNQDFKTRLRSYMEQFRLVGYDIEISGPVYISLDIELLVVVNQNYFRGDVKDALLAVLSNRVLPDGQLGLFHPDHFTFGQPVYVSPIYAAALAVEGVDAVQVIRFQRQNRPSAEALLNGKLDLERLEIARLDNDPNFPEHGILRLKLERGK